MSQSRSAAVAAVRVLGSSLLVSVALAAPLAAACSCVPERPRVRGCNDPITDFSGITAMRITSEAVESGPQGGRHIEFRVEAEGTGLRGCVAVLAAVHTPEEMPTFPSAETGVASEVSGSRVLSSPIYEFLDQGLTDFGPRTITVRALGRTATASVDTGTSPFPDAAVSGGEDAP